MIKTTIREFRTFLYNEELGSSKLLIVLQYIEKLGKYLEDITENDINFLEKIGAKTKSDFFRLRDEYHKKMETEYVQKEGYEYMTRKQLVNHICELEKLLIKERKEGKEMKERIEKLETKMAAESKRTIDVLESAGFDLLKAIERIKGLED